MRRLISLLAYTRIPGNAFSFWLRRHFTWSRGLPSLPDENKDSLFAYLGAEAPSADKRAADLEASYHLTDLRSASTADLYRKNLYLLDILDHAAQGLPFFPVGPSLRALDIGSQDWHYAFALERWLRHGPAIDSRNAGRAVSLTGLEIDAHERYRGGYTRRDYACAYVAQTGNAAMHYEVGDLLQHAGGNYDVITWLFPLVTAHEVLLWGLPLRCYAPQAMLNRASALLKPDGVLLTLTHSRREHDILIAMAERSAGLKLLSQGPALSPLVAFHEQVRDRFFAVWGRGGGSGIG